MIILIGIGMCGFAALAVFAAYVESNKFVKEAERERDSAKWRSEELTRLNAELSARVKEQELAIIKLSGGIK